MEVWDKVYVVKVKYGMEEKVMGKAHSEGLVEERVGDGDGCSYVKPVERFMPARIVETERYVSIIHHHLLE